MKRFLLLAALCLGCHKAKEVPEFIVSPQPPTAMDDEFQVNTSGYQPAGWKCSAEICYWCTPDEYNRELAAHPYRHTEILFGPGTRFHSDGSKEVAHGDEMDNFRANGDPRISGGSGAKPE